MRHITKAVGWQMPAILNFEKNGESLELDRNGPDCVEWWFSLGGA